MEIYFDTAATTPLCPAAMTAMERALPVFGNPSSLHSKGMAAEALVDAARASVHAALGVRSGRIVFTGSGTEANNLAILGAARKHRKRGTHLVVTAIEHASVLEAYRALEREGFQVTYVMPSQDGNVTAEKVLSALRDDTILVSMMHINNETGAQLPVESVGQSLRGRPKTLFHVDGVQSFGKVAACARAVKPDFYTMSAHKIGGPKGIGALWLNDGVDVEPLVYGGGQQYGLRSGTENTLGIAAFGAAAAKAEQVQAAWVHVAVLAEQLRQGLRDIPGCEVIQPAHASPYILLCLIAGLRGEVLVHAFESKGLYVSTGSACSSKDVRHPGSHVLAAMGRSREQAQAAVRFSLASWHREEDVAAALTLVRSQVEWVRSLL